MTKVDLSNIPDSEIIDDIINHIKEKEKISVKRDGKTLEFKDLSSRKIKFYTKKILGQANLPGTFKVISKGEEGFYVFFREFHE